MITENLAPVALEGQGIASSLDKHVLADAKKRGLLVPPVCPFFSAYLQKHPEHAAAVHPAYRTILGILRSDFGGGLRSSAPTPRCSRAP